MNKLDFLMVNLPDDVSLLIKSGNFSKAMEYMDTYLKRNIPEILKQRLIFEKSRIQVLLETYIYTMDEAVEKGSERIKGFTKEELEDLMKERFVDWILVEGNIRITRRFIENCIKVSKNIKDRLYSNEPDSKSAELRDRVIKEIINKGSIKYYIHIKAKLMIDENAKGNVFKVHLPIPKAAQQIKNIQILSTTPEYKIISSEDYPQRTIYFETNTDIKKFGVEYSFENHINYYKLDYDNVSEVQPNFYTNEWLPHIRFSPLLKELAKEIVGNESNPLRKARLIYDYITENVQYSFVRKYRTIESIAEYCAYNLKGDCGVQALLFITLCRIAGIPARWQSGLYVDPHYIGCHDWAEFYVAPYGWVFADPSFGGGALRNNDKVKWNFYFGNLDPFRMVANDEFHFPVYPEKSFIRDDPTDNQVGEAESDLDDLNSSYDTTLEIVKVKEI